MAELDLLLVADPRLAAAEARSLGLLVDELAMRDVIVGLLPVRSLLMRRGSGFASTLAERVDRDKLRLIDCDHRVRARLLLVWHIAPMLGPLDRPPQVDAGHAILRFEQMPWLDGAVDAQRLQLIRRCFAIMANKASTEEVAADPKVADLLNLGSQLWLSPVRIGELSPRKESRDRPIVGRHGGSGNAAWPMDASAFARAYPAGPGLQVNLLAAPIDIMQRRIDAISVDLRLLPEESRNLPEFLASLDLWQMAGWQGLPQPINAEVLEAAVNSVPLSLPMEAEGWPDDAAAFHDGSLPDPREDRASQVRAAFNFARANAEVGQLADRVAKRVGRQSGASRTLLLDDRSRRTVLMVSPNGVGMGHLTRLLAVARRLPGKIEPIFLTMSQAVSVVGTYGFHGEYLPYHSYYGGDPDYWNRGLLARLEAMIGFFDPRVLLFDGNVPYAALANLRQLNPNRSFVWLRRGLWRPDAGKAALERSSNFDLVIEPGEFAAEFDHGLTRTRGGQVTKVGPVTLLDPDEILSRDEARAELSIPRAAFAAIVLLGSQNNFDYGPIRQTIADRFARRPDVVLVEAEWLISENKDAALLPGARTLSGFPMARLFRAFDLAISTAGYNSFHELLSINIPTVFVPNEHPSMDQQEARAAWAEREGLGIAVRAHQLDRLSWALDAMQETSVGARMAENAANLPATDGAAAVAQLIEMVAVARDVSVDPAKLPHVAARSAPLIG